MKNELVYPLIVKELRNFWNFKFDKQDRINELKILWFRKIKIWKKEYIEFLVLDWNQKYQYLYEEKWKNIIQKFEWIEWYKELKIIWDVILVIWEDKFFYCNLYSVKNIDDYIVWGDFEAKNIDWLEVKVRKFLNI